MADAETTTTGEATSLSMSDEDFLNEPMPEDVVADETPKEPEGEPEAAVETTPEAEAEVPAEEPIEKVETKGEVEEVEEDVTSKSPLNLNKSVPVEEHTEKIEKIEKIEKTNADGKEIKTAEEVAIDYKAEFEKLTSTFRANGTDMQISNAEEARKLMQMGANYNKKMAGLKPNLRIMKMLENNDLLDEAKLTFLIDLEKKNPEAIQKFIKESGIDPLDIDTEKDTEYTPSTYTVNDKEMELDGVLDDIRDTQSFNETIDTISNKWDASSKKVALETPQLIKVINDQISNGIYGQIMGEVEKQRMLGELMGLSDLDAYKHVGDIMQAEGKFANVGSVTQTTTDVETPAATDTTTDKPKQSKDDPKLKKQKRAASPTKASPGTTKENDFNPLALSDAEFEKMASNDFI